MLFKNVFVTEDIVRVSYVWRYVCKKKIQLMKMVVLEMTLRKI